MSRDAGVAAVGGRSSPRNKTLLNETIVEWHNQLGLVGCIERIVDVHPAFKRNDSSMRSLRGRLSYLLLQIKKAKTAAARREIGKKEFKGPSDSSPAFSSQDNNDFNDAYSQKGLRPRRAKQLDSENNDDDSNDSFDGVGSRGAATRRQSASRINYNMKELANAKTVTAHDVDGKLVNYGGLNLCDCLDASCPGCHLPCPKCGSSRCGNECRSRRRWMYDHVEIEGTDYKIKNPALKSRGGGGGIS